MVTLRYWNMENKDMENLRREDMEQLSTTEWLSRVAKYSGQRQYKAMYSSWVGGVVTNPALMLIPIDDHMAHRGDAVFEAVRVTPRGPYLFDAHLQRLLSSAEKIDLKIPMGLNEIGSICRNLLDIAKIQHEGMLRIFVGRGFGDFSANPYSTTGSQIYIIAMDFASLAKEKYDKGVSLMISKVPVKPGMYAQVKSCNYLPNVMTKKDAIDNGYDFALNLTSEGFVTEGPTENLLIVSSSGELIAPKFDYTLRGTTLVRAMELAEKFMREEISDVRLADLHLDDLRQAREIMMVGTTLGILPVTKFEKIQVGKGVPGSTTVKLRALVREDMGFKSE